MSKFHKSCLALAVAAAIPTIGFAATFGPTPTAVPEIAQESLKDSDSTAALDSIIYKLEAGDILVGRTTAMHVTITLTGAEFTAVPVVNNNNPVAAPVTGVGINKNVLQFSMTPTGALAADAPAFTVVNPSIDHVGGSVSAVIQIKDAATGLELETSKSVKLATTAMKTSVSPVKASPAEIDVTAGKMKFVSGGTTVQLGGIEYKIDTDVVGGTYGAGDVFALTVTADDAGAFTPIKGDATTATAGLYFVVDADATKSECAVVGGTKLDVSATNANEFSAKLPLDTAVKYEICAVANGKTVILDKGFAVKGKVDFKDAAMVDYDMPAKALATLSYNGPVVDILSFNPASNADQLSYLRISNTSSTAGKITVDGICDNGVASKTPASFNLDAGKSVLLTSIDIEVGNAAKGMGNGLGSCNGGKYRLSVTGEVGSMKVQNFLRNVTSAGLINTNVNNEN